MAKKNELVATRVSPDALRVLQLALVLEEQTMQDLLRPVVEEYADKLAKEPEIRSMLEQVENYKERKTGVAKLQSRRKRSGATKKKSAK